MKFENLIKKFESLKNESNKDNIDKVNNLCKELKAKLRKGDKISISYEEDDDIIELYIYNKEDTIINICWDGFEEIEPQIYGVEDFQDYVRIIDSYGFSIQETG